MSKRTTSASVNAEQKRRDIEKYHDQIFYSARYSDDFWEYRHVILPKQASNSHLIQHQKLSSLPFLVKYLPTDRLAEEDEWRGLGIRQSPGWEHYMRHAPEPHVLLFKREKDYQTK
ncbi:regulatory subunit of cyclin-dependent kinase [Melampsora americana]|nr:regulatory subunit of cyclin-dependent kinase [Melampsora americana]